MRSEQGARLHQLAERHHVLAVVGLDVEEREVVGARALAVLDLQDHLVLIVCLLDQVLVILRVRVPQEREDARLGDAEDLCLLAQDVDLEIRRVVEPIRRERREARIGPQFLHQLPGGLVDLVGIHAGEGERVLALVLAGRARADLQHRIRAQEGKHARNGRDASHQASSHRGDWRPLLASSQEDVGEPLIRGEEGVETGDGDGAVDAGILADRLADALLQRLHLLRRGAFLGDEDAVDDAAVPFRKEGLGNHDEECHGAGEADHPDGGGDPAPVQEPGERLPVEVEHPLLDAADDPLHPGLLRAVPPVGEHP